ncbi:serine/arginine repetitive matrix protein 1-like [Camelus ferus]|uniref:Serine/arginine repetitive matrix protein 1-like n=1 Tax=Camelus ferus TaxID=419612 RepID=A0A8B8UED8_CAMFR|nr:serine/arginine repetitive matrix protein 1-like [Camelus ferus]
MWQERKLPRAMGPRSRTHVPWGAAALDRALKAKREANSKRLLSCKSGSPRRPSSVLGPRALRSPGTDRERATLPTPRGHSPAPPAPPPRDKHPPTDPRCGLPGPLQPRGRRFATSPERSPAAPRPPCPTPNRLHQEVLRWRVQRAKPHTEEPPRRPLWKKNLAAHASTHARAQHAPGRASLTCPRDATHPCPRPRSGRPPAPAEGPPAARSESRALTAWLRAPSACRAPRRRRRRRRRRRGPRQRLQRQRRRRRRRPQPASVRLEPRSLIARISAPTWKAARSPARGPAPARPPLPRALAAPRAAEESARRPPRGHVHREARAAEAPSPGCVRVLLRDPGLSSVRDRAPSVRRFLPARGASRGSPASLSLPASTWSRRPEEGCYQNHRHRTNKSSKGDLYTHRQRRSNWSAGAQAEENLLTEWLGVKFGIALGVKLQETFGLLRTTDCAGCAFYCSYQTLKN